MKRIVLGIQYDGAPWRGWQTQPEGGTVQDQLEAALARFAQTPISTTCAGRTDTGVHAIGQVVHFDTALEREDSSWVRGVNRYLPPSIAVRWAVQLPDQRESQQLAKDQAQAQGLASVEGGFHARFSARSRTYLYLLYNNPVRSPLLAGQAGWLFQPLTLAPMQEAARCLVGEHDFSAFRSAQCQAKTPVKTMYEIQIQQTGDLFMFSLRASAFLHHMVRNIVGSLIHVGTKKQSPAWLTTVLEGRVRHAAAPTFMPDGLYLTQIEYDAHWQLPQQSEASLTLLPSLVQMMTSSRQPT